jgi:hypothetical protein
MVMNTQIAVTTMRLPTANFLGAVGFIFPKARAFNGSLRLTKARAVPLRPALKKRLIASFLTAPAGIRS